MREIQPDNSDTFKMAKGTWRRVGLDGAITAMLVCPQCGARSALTTHKIHGDGEVHPSVVCDCGFHDWVRLVGWLESKV